MDDVERHHMLEAWFHAYADRVLAYLMHRTDPETAQDVMQEVFVIAFKKADVVPEPALGWLFGTARRVLANHRRSSRRRDRLTERIAVEATVSAAASSDALGTTDLLARAFNALSPADQEVLSLSTWYDLDADEASQALGCPRATYRVRLHRARRRLAERLEASDRAARRTDPTTRAGATHD